MIAGDKVRMEARRLIEKLLDTEEQQRIIRIERRGPHFDKPWPENRRSASRFRCDIGSDAGTIGDSGRRGARYAVREAVLPILIGATTHV
jgi:hypothetical protein